MKWGRCSDSAGEGRFCFIRRRNGRSEFTDVCTLADLSDTFQQSSISPADQDWYKPPSPFTPHPLVCLLFPAETDEPGSCQLQYRRRGCYLAFSGAEAAYRKGLPTLSSAHSLGFPI